MIFLILVQIFSLAYYIYLSYNEYKVQFVCLRVPHAQFPKIPCNVNFRMITIVNSIFSTLCILLNCMHIVHFASLFVLSSLNKDVLYEYLTVMK